MTSLEEENFLRLALVLHGVAPRAVRTLFDREFHPKVLTTTIRGMRTKLMDLFSKKYINSTQLDLLFPRTKGSNPDSNNFDVSLMICLLRNFTNIDNPKAGYDMLPQQSEQSKGADLARVKYYRNYLAHLNDNKIDNSFFEKAWDDISMAIERLGGIALKSECEKYRTPLLDQSNIEIFKEVQLSKTELEYARKDIEDLKDEMRQMKEDFDNTVNKNRPIRNVQPSVPQEYGQKIKEHFVETDTSRAIVQAIKENQCVIITGPPGSGKLMNTFSSAIQLLDNDNDIRIFSNIDEFVTIVRQFQLHSLFTNRNTPSKVQIYILNNVFGENACNEQNLNIWKESLGRVKLFLRRNVCKLVFTCRQHIYETNVKEQLGISVYHYPLSYSQQEVYKICQSYMKIKYEFTLPGNPTYLATLPAMFSAGMHHVFDQKGQSTVKTVEEFIQIEINRIEKESVWSIMAIVLLCLLNNCVEKQNFRLTDHTLDNLLLEMCFQYENRVSVIKNKIENAFSMLEGMYVSQNNEVYKFMYNWLFYYFADYVWERYNALTIKYGISDFFTDQFLLQKLKEKANGQSKQITTFPLLSDDVYFIRLVSDLKSGYVRNVFRCFRDHFLQRSSYLIDMIIEQGTSVSTDVEDRSTLLHVSSLFGITGFVNALVNNDSSGINEKNADYKTPLFYAAAMGFDQIVLVLLKYEQPKNESYDKYEQPENESYDLLCPLYIACANEHVEIVKILLESKTFNDSYNHYHVCAEDSPLHIACANGNVEIVNLLIKWKSPFSPVGSNIFTYQLPGVIMPLHIAISYGHTSLIEMLISNGADVNDQTDDGATPLCIAVNKGFKNIVRILLQNSAAVNKHNSTIYYPPPLYLASEKGHAEIVKILLQYNATSESNYSFEENSCLSAAIKNGHHKVVQVFLEHGSYFARSINIGCLLHLACKVLPQCKTCSLENKKATIQLLVDNVKDINAKDTRGLTPLIHSVINSDIETCELLIFYCASINCSHNGGPTPLRKATLKSPQLVNLMLQNKANVNEQDREGDTALHTVCTSFRVDEDGDNFCRKKFEMIELLLSRGADINMCNNKKYSPLHSACEAGSFESIPLLLKHGAKLNNVDATGKTPLYIACANALPEVVKTLLKHNAKVNQQCFDGSTALHAIFHYHLKMAPHFDSLEIVTQIVKLLLENGADVNQVDHANQSVLHTISETDNIILAGLLLKQHPNPYIVTKSGCTVLHIACKNKNSDMVSCLIKYAFDYGDIQIKEGNHIGKTCDKERCTISLINACDHLRKTPLHIACENKSIEIVDILLQKGAYLDGLDSNHCSPLFLACQQNDRRIVSLLLQQGANVNLSCTHGYTVLHLVCDERFYNLIELLLLHGVDVSKVDEKNLTALEIVRQKGDSYLETLFFESVDFKKETKLQ